MDLSKTLLLGFIAGSTIVIGLPIGRLRTPRPHLRLMLNAIAVGVLIFLIWDVLSAAWEPVDEALSALHEGDGTFGPVAGWSAARRLTLLIAVGIGLHNFAEGLAIGQSAASGAIDLAIVLVIGFALHNATEGFGIVAPLTGDVDADGVRRRPSWAFLGLMALIGGGPTFFGTWVGHGFTSDAVSVAFLTLAAGSIIYVVCQLLGMAARANRIDLVSVGILIGLLAGFATDAIVTAGGV